jgi:membrane-associated phospholipid phosphatase
MVPILSRFLDPGTTRRAGRAAEEFAVEHRLIVAFVAMIVFLGTYFATNHYPRTQPRVLGLTTIERSIPFLPDTVWIYASDLGLVFVCFCLVRGAPAVSRFVVGFFSLVVIGGLVHWTLPVAFPRELFPLPVGTNPATAFAITVMRSVDSPSSCVPSMHVAIGWFASLAVFHGRRKAGTLMMIWAGLVTASTLTAKQHFVIDVAAGIMLACGAYVLLFWSFRTSSPTVSLGADRLSAPRERVAQLSGGEVSARLAGTLNLSPGPDPTASHGQTASV